MTATLVYEHINHHSCAFPYEQVESTYGKSYYKLYQLKLRQLLTDSRSRQEYDGKSSKQKQSNDKRSQKEYMNHLREKMKFHSQNDDHGKRASSVLSLTNRRSKESITYTITSTEISTTNTILPTESRPKSILKTKQSPSSTKHQRVISAPASSQRNLRKKTAIKIPVIEIDDSDEDLSKSNAHSYTQVSSSSQDHMEKNNQYARQSILNTIVLHLHSYTPADLSKWNLYRDFDNKFSASISPRVYRNFERIIL